MYSPGTRIPLPPEWEAKTAEQRAEKDALAHLWAQAEAAERQAQRVRAQLATTGQPVPPRKRR